MKTAFVGIIVSVVGIAITEPSWAATYQIPGGQVTINCNKIGTGTYNAPWSFASFNGTPIFYVNTRVTATGSSDPPQRANFFVPPTFEYSNQYVFSSTSPGPSVIIEGEVVTPFGSIRIPPTTTAGAICPAPLP